MRLPHFRFPLPWRIGLSLLASLACLATATYLGFAARADATRAAAQTLAGDANRLASQIDRDLAEYDLTLRQAANWQPPHTPGMLPQPPPMLDLPLTASYIGFINILNESGDVVADPRSNVSRPANFAGRDYFQDHLKNPAESASIGRPFATAPNQHASIPISRRLNHPDGSFAGVVVAGVRLTWLSDLLSSPSPDPHPTITVRRSDGLILMRWPYDQDAIGRTDNADQAWQSWLRTGLVHQAADRSGIHLFHRLGPPNLVLELSLTSADIFVEERPWLLVLPLLALIPLLCVLGLGLSADQQRRRGDRILTAANTAYHDSQRQLANMSHELRTPLTGILGQAEMMTEEGSLNAQQAVRLARLTEAGALMRSVIDRVVDVARPENDGDPPVLTACDLDPLLQTALGMVEGEARRKGLLLTSSIDPDTPRRAMLERDHVLQMLNNLLMNAVKFTARGSVCLQVTGDTTQLRFAVADTGPGVPPEKQHRLFRAYDRLDIPSSRFEGSGLGLSINERLARRMGGQLGLTDNPGGGAIFWFELPFIAPAAAPEVPVPDPGPPEFCHLRVLLADDVDLTRSITAEFLRSGGHLVTEVADGEAAIDEVQQHDFDVLLTDMRMPIVDGLEVTKRVRALPGHRARTPIVLVTADLVAIRTGESGQAGVDVCLRKPFTRAELLAAVATAARLAPVPDAAAPGDLVVNQVAQAELRQTLGDAAFAARLDEAACRIADLVSLLDRPDAPENPDLRDAAHNLVGVAGLLGLTALASALQWFDTAADRSAAAAALHETAESSLRALRRHRETAAAGC